MDDGILHFRDGGRILISISETELIILGGSFDGETMERDPLTGDIYWQHLIYKPVNS